MKSGFKIMDSDMHLREPADLWDKYMEPEWRERAPKVLSSTARSSAMVMIEGKILRGYQPTYRGGIFDATRIDKEIADYRAQGFDAKTQLQAMDREGLDVAALYPSIGLGIMMRDDMDPKLAAAIARAYNNWLYDFCQTDPKRLKGVGMIPLHDPNEAVKEAQRAVGKLGFVGVFARPEPLRDMPWHARYFDTRVVGLGGTGSSARVSFSGSRRRSAADRRPLRRQSFAPPCGLASAGKHAGNGRYHRRWGVRAASQIKAGLFGMLLRLGFVLTAPDGQCHGERALPDGGQAETKRVFQTAVLDLHRA